MKSETLKHLKRRNTKKKKRDLSSKKKEKDKKKEKNKKKNHQPSLSTKIDRDLGNGRGKKSSIQELNDKKTKKKKNRKASESTSKILKKKKKDLKNSKNLNENKNLFVSGEVFMNSIYTDKHEPNHRPKKKKSRKLKNTLKNSKEIKKGKMFKIAKKHKDSPKEMTSKERKRYLSVNAGKNPLLESELMRDFNPRKTLNPKSISLKRGNSFKSNDIQKTELFTYKFQRDSLKKDMKNGLKQSKNSKNKNKKESLLYSKKEKTPQTALYQRNKSQVSSDNDDNQGIYKNLYSGRHEKNILEFNSNQSKEFSFFIIKKKIKKTAKI
jgi:hypothetical protein